MPRTLAVVHPENAYLSPTKVGPDAVPSYRSLFDRIVAEVGRALAAGETVYVFGQEARTANSSRIYAPLRELWKETIFIPGSRVMEAQFLEGKEDMVANPAGPIEVAGIGRDNGCAAELDALLRGRTRGDNAYGDYAFAARDLRWPLARFEAVYLHRLPSRIREDLTL